MESVIVGTAGHVDHGKTTLIQALTGIDTDRLKEEKERKLTIDLGFAPFDLPSGRRVSVIDVPGHEKFMGNMLAGIGGIDLVMLVIDANEGVMPQTKEHLEVIELLKIKKVIVVLTKIDTADEEWVELVEEMVKEELAGTRYADAEIYRTSAIKGIGIEELKIKLDQAIDTLDGKDTDAPLRLPIDRSFKMKGFGTVITGTLLAGKVEVDQEIEILPDKLKSRVRNIEVHNQSVDVAYAGQRTALNLAGVDKDDVHRGDVIAQSGYFDPTDKLDVEIELLEDFPHTLKHASRVHFHLGANEMLAKVYLLDKKELMPGEKCFAQLHLEEEVVSYYQDLFIVRFYSPVRTMGGGRVLNTDPDHYREYGQTEMEELKLLAGGSNEDLAMQKILRHGIITKEELMKEAKFSGEEAAELLESLLKKDMVFKLGETYYMGNSTFKTWRERVINRLEEFHQKNHLKPGISKAELKQVLPDNLSTQKYDQFLELFLGSGEIKIDGYIVSLADFNPEPKTEEEELVEKIKDKFEEGGVEPPGIEELAEELDLSKDKTADYILYLVYLEQLSQIKGDFYLAKATIKDIEDKIVNYLKDNGEITLGQARDLMETSRKYAMPIMEYLDQINVTRREGNIRVLV